MRTMQYLVLAAAGVTAGACSNASGLEQKPPRPVRAQVVAAAAPQSGIRYSASIEPFEQVQLAFKSSGYVDELLRRAGADGQMRAAQAGDFVGKGTVLARVREDDYRHRLDQSRSSLAEGEAGLKKSQFDLERARALFAADSLTKTDFDAAQASYDSAQARVGAVKADIELAANALRDCALVAPASGVLLERRVEVGSLVGAGTVGYLLGNVSSVKARFGIPDGVIQSVKLGDEIGVLVESMGGTNFPGRITAISPTADPHSRVFDVEVTIRNQDGRLRPGMIGTVAMSSSAAAPAAQPLTLPLGAVVRAPGNPQQYAVVVIERQGEFEVARFRRVDLGDVVGNGVTVTGGVNAGERVITTGATLLTDGDRVRIIP